MRSHPSQWAPPVEPPRSGPQRHSSSDEGEPARGPDELPVRRPRPSGADPFAAEAPATAGLEAEVDRGAGGDRGRDQ